MLQNLSSATVVIGALRAKPQFPLLTMFIEYTSAEGLDGGGVWYSLFIKNLAYYSSH